MTLDITPVEAEILVAVLTGAEDVFAIMNPPLATALVDLRDFRTRLLRGYLAERVYGKAEA